MNNEIVNAMEELEKWLADPAELGRKPAKIEYTASFEDEDGIKCMIFKFKKSFFGKWLLGIVSESGTFSEMKEYNSSTETGLIFPLSKANAIWLRKPNSISR